MLIGALHARLSELLLENDVGDSGRWWNSQGSYVCVAMLAFISISIVVPLTLLLVDHRITTIPLVL